MTFMFKCGIQVADGGAKVTQGTSGITSFLLRQNSFLIFLSLI